VWDIATPTHRENSTTLPDPSGRGEPPAESKPPVRAELSSGETEAWRKTEARIRAQLPCALADRFSACLAQARQAVGMGEDDDWLYARAQARVRAAVLAVGQALSEKGTIERAKDVFFLPLETIRSLDSRAVPPPASLRDEIARARARWQAALQNPPPLPSSRGGPSSSVLAEGARGSGTGGRAIGPVFLWPGSRRPARNAIVVATALLPTELPLLDVAGLVTETGGPLGHVATQARERGLPAVVGAAGATRLFNSNELVLVDADRGIVLRCSARQPT